MNWSEEKPEPEISEGKPETKISEEKPESEISEEKPEPETSEVASEILFIGDTGVLPLETRRVFVQLLIGPAIDARFHSKLWPILLRDEAIIRSRLSELFLTLMIDRDLQVAFTQQADTGELETPLLLRRAQLTFIDSVLLLYLRQCLTQSEARGERAVVATDEMIEYLKLYTRDASTDHAGFIKRMHASIEKIKKHRILHKIRAAEDRFEISPTLKILFSAERIQTLTKLYQQMAMGEVNSASTNNTAFADETFEVKE